MNMDDSDGMMTELADRVSLETMMVATHIPGEAVQFEANVLASVFIIATDAVDGRISTDTKTAVSPSMAPADFVMLLRELANKYEEKYHTKEDASEPQRDSGSNG